MKINVTLLSVIFCSGLAFGQKSISKNGVTIDTKPLHCNVPSEGYEADLIQLAVVNTTNEVKTITYSFQLYYDGQCATCDQPEYVYTQVLQPKEKLEGVCLDRTNLGLTIFDHMPANLTKTQLTDFNIIHVSVH
ncbi:MAG: hypothetical protein RLZZ301_1361 [Bacteroidota bacterium]|jgi:hypothetical protein